MTLDRFYQLVREAVMVHPDNLCYRPKTFAVIDHIQEINVSSLKKSFDDYDKQFFWSESWRANNLEPNNVTFNYPMVTATYINSTLPVNGTKGKKIRANVHLNCFDIISDDCKEILCSNRASHEIERDCLQVLVNIMHYLENIVIAEYKGEINLYNKDWLEYRKNCNNESYKIIRKALVFADVAEPVYASQYETGIEFTYGALVKLSLAIDLCAETNYNMTISEPLKKITTCCG